MLTLRWIADEPERPYLCPNPRCGKRYKSEDGLLLHHKNGVTCGEQHKEKLFTCPTLDCQKRFGTKARLNGHLRRSCRQNKGKGGDLPRCPLTEPVHEMEGAVVKPDQRESGSSQPQQTGNSSQIAGTASHPLQVWDTYMCPNPLCGQSMMSERGQMGHRREWFCSRRCKEREEEIKHVPGLARWKRLGWNHPGDSIFTFINEYQCNTEEQEPGEEDLDEIEAQETMTSYEIQSCSSLNDLFERLRFCYKRCRQPDQPIITHLRVIGSPDTIFAGECLIKLSGPPESLKSESERTLNAVLSKLRALEIEDWFFSKPSVQTSGNLIHILCCCSCKKIQKDDQIHPLDTQSYVRGQALQNNPPQPCSGFLEVIVVTQRLVPDWSSFQNRVTVNFNHPREEQGVASYRSSPPSILSREAEPV